MWSHTSPQQLTVTVLAALWLSLGGCGASGSPWPGCDNGKLSLEKDLPAHWDCPASTWAEPHQRLPSVDTVYDPEPAQQICMNRRISYNHTVPNSGAYRPVMADSGEYFYCPPQRWLNNLHHGATVFLYHPCAPLQERLHLSGLARSCLQHYVITPHPQLSKHMPIALVSWGRTLELSTLSSLDVCDWLEATTTTENFNGVSRKYNLLLIWKAESHEQQEHSTKMKARRCCEQTISSMLNGAMGAELETSMKMESLKQMREDGKSRQIRAAIRETLGNAKGENTRDKRAVQNYTSSLLSPPGNKTLPDPPGSKEAPSQSKIEYLNKDPTPRPTTPLRLSVLKRNSLGSGHSVSQKTTNTTGSEAPGFRSRDGVTDSAKKRASPPQPQLDLNTKAASYLSDTPHCNGCTSGDGAGARASVVKKGLQRTPRTDEAVWAAAALGFLLVLLTLSVLHTRLYRHWRTMPSLYWHDPQQDYDSVADVIRRRLRIAKRRRKRGRRQECVLLPSSSSSDEHL